MYVVETVHITATGVTEQGPSRSFDQLASAEHYALNWCQGGRGDEQAEIFQILDILEEQRRRVMSFARQPDGVVTVRDHRLA